MALKHTGQVFYLQRNKNMLLQIKTINYFHILILILLLLRHSWPF